MRKPVLVPVERPCQQCGEPLPPTKPNNLAGKNERRFCNAKCRTGHWLEMKFREWQVRQVGH